MIENFKENNNGQQVLKNIWIKRKYINESIYKELL